MQFSGPFHLHEGVVTARRDARHLQLGIDPPGRVILRESAEVRDLLTRLADGLDRPPSTPAARCAFDDLVAAGLISAPESAPHGTVRLAGAPDLVAAATGLLGDTVAQDADVVLLLEPGQVRREHCDPLLRDGTPHLVVAGAPDLWVVGPFVVPGVTACLRCVDATLGEHDPRRALVVEQVSRQRRPRADPLLAAMAIPYAVRDVLTYLRGDPPLTWSSTLAVPRKGAPTVTSWRRHPHCGCSWDAL